MGETDGIKESEDKAPEIEKAIEAEEKNSSEEPSELEGKIIRQIEYYFGDHNLLKDKFLQGQLKENDGWVALNVLVTFNRLKTLSDDCGKILAAIKKSQNKLIEISEDEAKIRRNPEKPVPERTESWKEEQIPRTVYVKGFPVDSTLDTLTDFFNDQGSIENIYMKKKINSKSFKGSIFATFATADDAEAFVKVEGQKYKNTLLIKEFKADYLKRKEEEFVKRKEEREKRKQDKNNEDDPVKEYPFNPEEDMVKGCLLKLSGFARGTTREHIKDLFNLHAKVAYVEFRIGDEEGVVRFEEAGVAKDALEKSLTGEGEDKGLVINNTKITTEFIEGEDEVEYWKKLVQARCSNKERRSFQRRGRATHRGRGRGDYRGGRGDYRSRGGRGGNRDRYFDRRDNRRDDRGEQDRKRQAEENNGETPPVKQEKKDESSGTSENQEKEVEGSGISVKPEKMDHASTASERKRPAEDSSDGLPTKQIKNETS